MFDDFDVIELDIKTIKLDPLNPRLVNMPDTISEDGIIQFLFAHHDLAAFLQKLAREGHNPAAEIPYVVADGETYTVVEGNTRIAAYKLLTGVRTASADYASLVPRISKERQDKFQTIRCSLAPNRDALLPIMANAHFGSGDKSRWGYLGSRKAVFDDTKEEGTYQRSLESFR